MPRSGTDDSRAGARARGFNEAGAIMPRSGFRRGSGLGIAAGPASMRPGQSCPGVGKAGTAGEEAARPGFNEAGAIMPRSG